MLRRDSNTFENNSSLFPTYLKKNMMVSLLYLMGVEGVFLDMALLEIPCPLLRATFVLSNMLFLEFVI